MLCDGVLSHVSSVFFFFLIDLFIWLHQVLVAVGRFCCPETRGILRTKEVLGSVF